MPGIFSRLKSRDGRSKKKNAMNELAEGLPQKRRWDDAYARKTVDPEEIQELLRGCTEELKARGLDHPLFLLPFRPTSNPSAVRTFIRNFFSQDPPMSGEVLAQELRMTDPMVIAGVLKWCWSRLQGGVVGWDAYELFKVGEFDSNMARDSFKTFIPLSVENNARQHIIFDFFGLIAAIAAHGKTNGFGGRKLSRMVAWWAFEHKDSGNGFDGGYGSWLSAADATTHLFFAYLRSLSPEQNPTGITLLPRSLQKLLQETEYPPQRPELLMAKTKKVVMIVETVSPTPFALLRRANHFQYRDSDKELQAFSNYEDPVKALTEECRRVLRAISAANQSQASSSKHSTSLRDASWSRFEDIGFSGALDEDDEFDESALGGRKPQQPQGLRTSPSSGGNGLARPTTPSWADFLSSGFVDDNQNKPNLLLPPPDQVLPPLTTEPRQNSSQSHHPRLESGQNLEPGELASIRVIDLDDAFWWVWMSSLAPEETPDRKSAFGRCAIVETQITGGRWLVMEEMIAGAGADTQEGAYIAEKKGFFSWTRRARTISRRKSTSRKALDKGDKNTTQSLNGSKTSIGPDAHARIQAKAAQLRAKQSQEQNAQATQRRGRTDAELLAEKTNSVFVVQPAILGEASSALNWVNKYDKGAIKDAYMANSNAGRGMALSENTNGHASPIEASTRHVSSPKVPPKDGLLTPAASHLTQQPTIKIQTESQLPLSNKVEKPRPSPLEKSRSVMSGLPTPPREQEQARILSPTFSEKITSSDSAMSLESMKQQKGFRKLFGRKERNSKLPENASADLDNMLQQDMTKPESAALPSPSPVVAPSPISTNAAPASTAPDAPVEEVSKEPQFVEPTFDPSVGDRIAHVDIDDAAEAEREFSKFSQGPLVEQPAFVPETDDDEDDAVPPPIARLSRQDLYKTMSDSSKEELSQGTSPGIQDRWAQIRKNAADRAVTRPSEEQSVTRYSKTTDGDDETSGEETIESRVARIKARVAELTGNMEGTTGPLRR